MFIAGDQIPVIPLSDVVGKVVNVAPEQIAATGVNVGVIFVLTVTVEVAEALQPKPLLIVTVNIVVFNGTTENDGSLWVTTTGV